MTSMLRPGFTALAVLSACVACSGAFGQEPDLQLRYVDAFPAADHFERPIYMAHHKSDPGHLYVVGQHGHLWRVDRKDGSRTVWLEWTQDALGPRKNGHNEEGLLGFQFDPAYPERPYIYLYYSEQTGPEKGGGRRKRIPRQSVVSRLEVKGEGRRPDPQTELRLMEVEQPWGNHNGGTLEFGPDGMLYIVFGDGGFADDPRNHAQNLGTVLGSICRIDVRESSLDAPYAVPADNPFMGQEGVRGEIWAYGLRNPWRMAFDSKTGELWCADVGQDTYEEVNRIVRGGNYGWNLREATHGFTKRERLGRAPAKPSVELLPPVAEYDHDVGLSITGGYVYRGKAIPELQGRYIYGDFVTRAMFAVAPPVGDETLGKVIQLPRCPGMVAAFGQDVDGEVFVLAWTGGPDVGRILKLAPPEKPAGEDG